MKCTAIMVRGKKHNVEIPGDNMDDVREWLNTGQSPNRRLARFISIGNKAVLNINHIVSVVPREE
jgi:hypothetical protein